MTSQRCSFPSAPLSPLLAGPNGSPSGPCKCCPYGFHIDTDFVRYCDALITALYGNNRSLTNSTCRSFGSLRRKLNLALASPELFTSPTSKSFLPYCDYTSSKKENSQRYPHHNHLPTSCFETNDRHFSPKEHSVLQNRSRPGYHNHFHSTASIETDFSAAACETESMLTEAVNKFEEVLLESASSSKSTLYTSNVNGLGAHESPPPSPAPSSCPSSSISRSVLTQIRNHLALSLTRVKELESQVAQIPLLKEQIVELQAQRNELIAKLDGQKCRKRRSDGNGNFIRHWGPTLANGQEPSYGPARVGVHTPARLSFTKCESISIAENRHELSDKATRSVGTLTSFAPSLPPRNAFAQTDSVIKQVEAACQIAPRTQHMAIDTADLCSNSLALDSKSATTKEPKTQSGSTFQDASVQVSLQSAEAPKLVLDKSVSTSELSISAVRPASLDLMIDSSNQWLYPEKSTTLSSFNCSSPSSSSQSIRLCDKCHQMINSSTSENLSQDIAAFSLPKIIKSDSGISVERRQVDSKAAEESDNLLLVFPGDLEMSSSMYTQSSEDHDNAEQQHPHRAKVERKPLDWSSVQPTAETKASLKVIHENLTEPKKSSSFLFSKSVSFVKKVWFKVSSSEDSDSRIVELYLDCFEKFSMKLLDFVVNLSDTAGNTAIHYSISFQNFDVVSVLLDSKVCDVNNYNKAGYTATMLVSLVQLENDLYRDVVDRLFRLADVNMKAKQNGQTALMLAASHGRLEICKMLLNCGAEVNLQDNDGSTALMCAAEHGHPNVISLLLSHPDCDPLLEDNEGSSALKIALINGHNDVGILLYTGTRISNTYYASSCYSSLGRLPNSPIYSGHMPRSGSFSSYSAGNSLHNASALSLSLRTSPPRNRHASSMSTPSSPSRS